MTNFNIRGGLCGRCGEHSEVLINVNDNGLYCPHCSFVIGAKMSGEWHDDYDPKQPLHDEEYYDLPVCVMCGVPTNRFKGHKFECPYAFPF